MLCDGMSQKRSARPPNPCVVIALGEVEKRGLAGEECQVDSCLLCGRRMTPKDRIVLPSPAVKQLARADGVGCLGSSEQRYTSHEDRAVWLGSIGDAESAVRFLAGSKRAGQQAGKQSKRDSF